MQANPTIADKDAYQIHPTSARQVPGDNNVTSARLPGGDIHCSRASEELLKDPSINSSLSPGVCCLIGPCNCNDPTPKKAKGVTDTGACWGTLYLERNAFEIFEADVRTRKLQFSMQRRMLSQQDEEAVGNEELEVRREDQDKINKFSRLHQRETLLEEELKSKAVSGLHSSLVSIQLTCPQKEKEDLEEISNELELADEDEKVPYKLGDAFIMLPLPEVQELLAKGTATIEKSVSATEEKLSSIREEMESLKVDLYARFGKSINLET
ncbi:MAG: hypothetical protein LQ338_005551 [Usnochroma carphineum]|nr:MAG: hypothetical protein LQ338_005551 [Usnochroma carphineum]